MNGNSEISKQEMKNSNQRDLKRAAEEVDNKENETEQKQDKGDQNEASDQKKSQQQLLIQLEEWFIGNPKLPKRVERLLLERFLLCSNNDLAVAQTIIEANYSIRNKYPEIFLNRDPAHESSKATFDYADIVPLPNLTPEGYKITVLRLRDMNPQLIHHLEDTRSYIMLTDVRFSMPDIEETKNTSSSGDNELISSDVLASGEVQLFDMNGFTMQHATRLSFSVLRIYIRFLQTAFPVRIRQIHMINCPTYLNKIVAIVRPFLSREVFNMMHFHTNGIEDLYNYIPQAILPEEYGGQAGKLDDLKSKFMTSMAHKRDYLINPDYWRTQAT